MGDEEVERFELDWEFESNGDGVYTYTITTPGAEVRLTYTERDPAIALAMALPEILLDASEAMRRGDCRDLPVKDPFENIKGLEMG